MWRQIVRFILRVLVLILIAGFSAFAGLILGAIVGGNLAAVYELLTGSPFIFNGREGYEATGQIGIILGALAGFAAGGWFLFGRRSRN